MPYAVMEAVLVQAARNKSEAAYARGDLFKKQCALTESWSDYLAG